VSADEALALAFGRKHPDRVAVIVETSSSEQLADFFERLPPEVSGPIAARATPNALAGAVAAMELDAGAELLAALNPRIAAAIARRLGEKVRRGLLGALSKRARGRIEQLLAYQPDQIASRVDLRAPSVARQASVEHALQVVREGADGALHYVYVVDEAQKLVGVCNMRELMSANPRDPVGDIMVRNPERLVADDPLDSLVVHPGWRKVHALPVVDGQGQFIGVIRYSGFRELEAEMGRSRSVGSEVETTAALAELFSLGASAMMQLGEVAVLGGRDTFKRGGR
jgi:magnesium transporter